VKDRVDLRGIGLALRYLHHLADQRIERLLLPGAHFCDDCRIGREHVVLIAVPAGKLPVNFAFLAQPNTQLTDWAMYPAIGLLVASLLAFILGRNFQNYWAVILLVVGVLLIVSSLLPKKPKEPTPPTNPS